MSSTPPNGELVRVVPATPEEVAACQEALIRAGNRGERWPGEKLVGLYFVVAREVAQSVGAAPRYLFCKVGNQWKVIFDGGTAFYLRDTLGARYLDHLLHDPNKTISAFELEAAITPEKGEARSRNSIQPQSDPQAMSEYREALRSLELERKRARKAGDRAKARDLDRDIKRVRAALREHGGITDTGERARNNVRHAIDPIKAQLQEGSSAEQAFAKHLERYLSVGMECQYSQPQGRIWE